PILPGALEAEATYRLRNWSDRRSQRPAIRARALESFPILSTYRPRQRRLPEAYGPRPEFRIAVQVDQHRRLGVRPAQGTRRLGQIAPVTAPNTRRSYRRIEMIRPEGWFR